MKIKVKGKSEQLVVFGIYWKGENTYFLCSPKGYDGLLAISEVDSVVIDNSVDSELVFWKSENGLCGFYHKVLLEDSMLESLLEYDPGAYKLFLKRVRLQ